MIVAASAEITTVIELVTRHSVDNPTVTVKDHMYATVDVLSRCYRVNAALQNVAFAIRDMAIRAPNRLQTELGMLLEFFESNKLIGWESAEMIPTFQLIRDLTEHFTGSAGLHMAFLVQMHKCIDVLYQTRITFSLFYHHLDV